MIITISHNLIFSKKVNKLTTQNSFLKRNFIRRDKNETLGVMKIKMIFELKASKEIMRIPYFQTNENFLL